VPDKLLIDLNSFHPANFLCCAIADTALATIDFQDGWTLQGLDLRPPRTDFMSDCYTKVRSFPFIPINANVPAYLRHRPGWAERLLA
jgi:hypothetical protein